MRWALLVTLTLGGSGCFDFSVPAGALRCDPALAAPCPESWRCLLEASADRLGRCYPPGNLSSVDGRLVGPLAAPAVSAPGKRYYIDPQRGRANNPGSAAAPWRTLAEVVKAGLIERRAADGALTTAGLVKAGDALVLRDGDHGSIDLSGYYNPQRVYVLADEGARPRLSGLTIRTGRNWWFHGLTIQASGCSAGAGLVTVGESGTPGAASLITLTGSWLRSTKDASGWDKDDWKSRACNGLHLTDVTDVRAAFNELRNLREGVRVHGKRITVERNLVDRFIAKGLAITGKATAGVKILSNLVQNAYDLGLFQAMIHGGLCNDCKEIEIRNNRLLAHRDLQLPAGVVQSAIQGIGLFDGPLDGVVIVNNLVICQHWNGIVVLNGKNVEIINNTTVLAAEPVIPSKQPPSRTWIEATGQASGTLDTITVRNNLTNEVKVASGATVDHNGEVTNPAAYFEDWRNGDYRPRQGGPAENGGSTTNAPVEDLFGQPRDGRPDLGALER